MLANTAYLGISNLLSGVGNAFSISFKTKKLEGYGVSEMKSRNFLDSVKHYAEVIDLPVYMDS
ncbi:hypothetical protein BCE02nite_54760 [Brevibacillus centrosporus]|nr:hypothetical protein BCE02nite_54760 [Brevibacillus centrosporus]